MKGLKNICATFFRGTSISKNVCSALSKEVS